MCVLVDEQRNADVDELKRLAPRPTAVDPAPEPVIEPARDVVTANGDDQKHGEKKAHRPSAIDPAPGPAVEPSRDAVTDVGDDGKHGVQVPGSAAVAVTTPPSSPDVNERMLAKLDPARRCICTRYKANDTCDWEHWSDMIATCRADHKLQQYAMPRVLNDDCSWACRPEGDPDPGEVSGASWACRLGALFLICEGANLWRCCENRNSGSCMGHNADRPAGCCYPGGSPISATIHIYGAQELCSALSCGRNHANPGGDGADAAQGHHCPCAEGRLSVHQQHTRGVTAPGGQLLRRRPPGCWKTLWVLPASW